MTKTKFETPPSTTADAVLESMCRRYASAVNTTDSAAYSKLFTEDAIRMPPGTDPEYGREQIRKGEQSDYDVARWSIRSTPVDARQVSEDWIYGIAHVDATTTAHLDGAKTLIKPPRHGSLDSKLPANGAPPGGCGTLNPRERSSRSRFAAPARFRF